jgi:beta-N-acetylhexosaminidase
VASLASSPSSPGEDVDRSVGAAAARRAIRSAGDPRLPADPLVVELVPEANRAAGAATGGLGRALKARRRDASVVLVRREEHVSTDQRPLVLVLRDAGRHPWQRALADELISARPDAIVVETGLPGWLPDRAAAWIVTHGQARVNMEAAADLLTRR